MKVKNPDFVAPVWTHKDAAAVVAAVKASGKEAVTFAELLERFPSATHGDLRQIVNDAGLSVEE